MQVKKNRLFWDGPLDSFSEVAKLKRVIEYGSFAELIQYPYSLLKKYISEIKIEKLRTSEARKEMLILLMPYLLDFNSWKVALKEYTIDCFKYY